MKGDGCWLWTGRVGISGYGMFYFHGKLTTAHRAIFRMENPTVSVDGMDICHRCDNRLCVRPDHLFVGTRKQNMEDMSKKGRSLRGWRNSRAKLNQDQVEEIKRDMRRHGPIAEEYGVDRAVISRIKSGKAYAPF
jgi:hypothetical protein